MTQDSMQKIAAETQIRCAAAQEKYNAFINYDPELIKKGISIRPQKGGGSEADGGSFPLAGLSFTLADAICTEQGMTTNASSMLASYQPGVESTAALKLRESGAFLAGKTNMDEFGLGATGVNSFTGPVKNPRDLKYSAGSGSAAAVSAEAVQLALAPDVCGELRTSAAYCGIPALKPTYGRVSRKGLIESAPSLEQIGLLASNITDLAAALDAISGYDPWDATSSKQEAPSCLSALRETGATAPIKAAVPHGWGACPYLDGGVRETFSAALSDLEKNNFHIETVTLPNISHSLMTATIIRAVETFSSLANYDGVRFGIRAEGAHLQEMYKKTRTKGFERRLRAFLTFGALVSSGKYYRDIFLKAQKMRTIIIREMEQCLHTCDFLLLPATPGAALLLDGAGGAAADGGSLPDPAGYYSTVANLAGLPAVTFPIPCAASPVGSINVQIIGKAWDEAKLLQTAQKAYSNPSP